VFLFSKDKLLSSKKLELFLRLFDEKAHLQLIDDQELYVVNWDGDVICSEKELLRFMYSEDAEQLFTLNEIFSFENIDQNLGKVDEAAFQKFESCLDKTIH